MAINDLKQIWNYTVEKWSEKQADQYYREVIEHWLKVPKNPALGKKYENIYTGLMGSQVNKHIIFYRQINPQEIEVARILHERMNIKSRLLENG